MDPDATLADIVWAIEGFHRGEDIDIDTLVEQIGSLDEWLTKGGYLPCKWQSSR